MNRECCTFNPYCSLATYLFSEMNTKSLLFKLKGRGMMSETKTSISNMRRAKTYGFIC